MRAIWEPKLARAALLDEAGEDKDSLDGSGCSGVG
jgi:hypothetical protein